MDIVAIDGDFAGFSGRHRLTGVVQHRDPMARVGPAHAARLGRPALLAVADHVVHFGLAEHFVGRHAQGGLAPLEDGLADAFAGAHDRAQGQLIAIAGFGHRFHHHLERGREQEGVGDLIALHQLERPLDREAAAGADDGMAEIQRGQQRIHHAAGPGPVGRRPEHVGGPRKPVLRGHEAGQVADQRAVRQQGALGRAGGAGGIEQDGRIRRARRHRLEFTGLARQQAAPGQHALVGEADADDLLQVGAVVADGQQVGAGGVVDDGDAGLRIAQAALQGFGTEQGRQRQHHRAHAVDRHVRDHGLRALSQNHTDAVAAAHAHLHQAIGQLIGGLGQPRIGPDLAVAGFIFVVDGDAPRIRTTGCPAVAARFRNVELGGNQPAECLVEHLILVVHGPML
ncbi:Uncharacterised protein [Achromobacter xylosoxidans]|nr:Uncharacterised protein [Achromobacter xylosoxidans]